MKVSEMIENLNKILKEDGDLDVVYSVDDEGNSFHEVGFEPTVGHFEDDEFNSVDSEQFEEYDLKKNAVCIN